MSATVQPPSTDLATTVAPQLLDWYDSHARSFPWRAMPGEPPADPYRVWLSEVMLQQTTTAAVIPYFETFTATWPDIDALAGASEEAVMAAWAGLGYYSRARNLVACAREVSRRGGFPTTEAELRELPGIGDYTGAAIAAIAFGRRAAVVDANIERVTARLFAIRTPLPAARKAIRAQVGAMTPADRPGDFAQALMDLGAQICTPRAPRCLMCPLASACRARAEGEPEALPVKPPRKQRPTRRGKAWWIEKDGQVWLVRRAARGMLGGMRALPDDGWSARADGSDTVPAGLAEGEVLGTVRHGFTHALLELTVCRAHRTGVGDPPGEGRWWPLSQLEEAGLPTLYAKAARLALARES